MNDIGRPKDEFTCLRAAQVAVVDGRRGAPGVCQ
jgi:hypothetical protein